MRLTELICGLAGLAMLMPVQAGAADLFTAAPKPESARADVRVAREQFVAINPSVLSAEIHNMADDATANRVARSQSLAGDVSLPLFSGKSVRLHRSGVEAGQDGGVIWTASVEGGGNAVLVVENNTVAGFLEVAGHQYLIDPAGGGLHTIRELRMSALPKDVHVKIPAAAARQAASAPLAEATTTTSYIFLLAAYTAKAKADITAKGATVQQIVDRDIAVVNLGFTASGLPMRLRRAGIVAVSSSYSEDTVDGNQPLYDITSGTKANFPTIRSQRTSLRADLVAMYVRRKAYTYCGVAWVNGPTPVPDYGFGVVDSHCAGTVTLAHELGHTMGLHHDRYVEPAAPASSYSYGFVSTAGNFRDIMSYSAKCRATLGRDCPIYTYYSKPTKTINGVAAGVPKGVSGAADASRWLLERATTIARFR